MRTENNTEERSYSDIEQEFNQACDTCASTTALLICAEDSPTGYPDGTIGRAGLSAYDAAKRMEALFDELMGMYLADRKKEAAAA